MNELSTGGIQLPDSYEDLARFVLIGREKLNAVRAQIRAIQKVGLAKEVHEQKLHEAQEIAEAVLDAEVKIGELTAKIKKATPNNNPYHEIDNAVELVKPKPQALEEIGIPQHTAERFERMARNTEAVQKAKEEARAEGKIVTRQDVLNRIAMPSKKQEEAKELREAKQRAEDYQATPKKVMGLEEIKQNKEDNALIFGEFRETVRKANMALIQVAIATTNDATLRAIEKASEKEISELWFTLNEIDQSIAKARQRITEVFNEKQL